MKPKYTKSIAASASVVLAIGASALVGVNAAGAGEIKLPKQMTWTAYGTTSTGYQQSVAIGNVLKKKYGMQLNIKTGKNDVARMLPLKSRKADFCSCGIAFYFAHEGVFMFGKKNWGPQAISMAMASIGGAGIGLGVAKELTFSGRLVSGTEAVGLGLCTHLSDDPRADALALASDIAAKSPHAIRAAKRIFNDAPKASLADGFAQERSEIGQLIGSPNQIEQVKAFFDKRQPEFVDPD